MMYKDDIELIKEANDQGIYLFLEGDTLKYKVRNGCEINKSFLEKLSERKDYIKAFLRDQKINRTPIVPRWDGTSVLPLSFSQERLWFIDSLEGSLHYHIPFVFWLMEDVDLDFLEVSLRSLIGRHGVLRCVIDEIDGVGHQRVLSESGWSMGRHSVDDRASADRLIQILTGRPFDLSSDYMLRADVIECPSTGVRAFVCTFHHIASDGWSHGIFLRELEELYRSSSEGRGADLPDLPVQYWDYSVWQRKELSGGYLADRLNYWRGQLSGTVPLELPTDRPRPVVPSHRGSIFTVDIPAGLLRSVEALCSREGVTAYMYYLSVLQILLWRYSGQVDICVGSPVSGRQRAEIQGLIGFFVNTVVLRGTLDGESSFSDHLHGVRAMVVESLDHQDVPFEKVVEALSPERELGRSPLFQVMFVFDEQMGGSSSGGLFKEGSDFSFGGEGTSKFDLTFNVFGTGDGGFGLGIEYSTDLYDVGTVERMAGHFLRLAGECVDSSHSRLWDLRLLDSAEERSVLELGLGAEVSDLPAGTVVDVFREVSERYV
ncbi:condensation domain-containing protein, partial [Sphingobacterium sp. UBA7253]